MLQEYPMPTSPKQVVTTEELAMSNMYQLEAVIRVLERKGIMTAQRAGRGTGKMVLPDTT